MKNPSPRSHLLRLGFLGIVALFAFLGVKAWQTPASWNFEVWYRGAVREEVANLPSVHGGNESCQSCHEDAYDDATSYAHKNLNCEGCHGPLTEHVDNGEKIADAKRGSNWQCLNCHSAQVSMPPEHPQYPGNIRRHEQKKEDTLCVKCHDPHDPTT